MVRAFGIACCAIRGASSQTRIEQPAKLALLMVVTVARLSANCLRQERPLVMGRAVSRVVDQSSVRAASAMIDVEGRTWLARAGFGAALIPYDICGENHGTNAG